MEEQPHAVPRHRHVVAVLEPEDHVPASRVDADDAVGEAARVGDAVDDDRCA